MTFLYLGYGSNMLTARLRARCPGAELAGVAEVSDHVLEFSKRSTRDGSGKATLRHREGSGDRAFGVVFQIPVSERGALDEAEGLGDGGYQRGDDFHVQCVRSGGWFTTSCYLATAPDPSLKPYDWYLAVTIAGAIEHGLDDAYLARLKQTDYDVDACLSRPGRVEVVEALQRSGIDDYRALLPSAPVDARRGSEQGSHRGSHVAADGEPS